MGSAFLDLAALLKQLPYRPAQFRVVQVMPLLADNQRHGLETIVDKCVQGLIPVSQPCLFLAPCDIGSL